jgi:DNA-binding CsgD family transcriptional regulator
LAEANALIAQRKEFAKTDYERARILVAQGHISQQVADARRNKGKTKIHEKRLILCSPP